MALSKTYDPKQVEDRLYEWWHSRGYFKPENQIYIDPTRGQFVITIPPPNVTGTLHMGHALTSAVEDLMTRYARMRGARTLWVPGTDHAGIATQAIVEKNLAEQGKHRQDMSRSDFLEEVWSWKAHSHGVITKQQKALGISVDWDREAFTMDDNLSLAVRTAFKRLYDKGLIYRDYRMVNWDPVQQTGVSDLEVETEEDGEPGFLYYVRYPLQTNRWDAPQHEWGSGKWAEGATVWITVATTRPETILGDTAVMVNPEDDRYASRVACHVVIPGVNRVAPIIADKSVDSTFGTGAVKVTPAHDFTDYDVGKRHHLPFVEVMDARAKMNANAGPYAGMDRFECRKKLIEDLKHEGLFVKQEDYRVKLGRGQRSGAVIEPRISLQWWCKTDEMAARSVAAVREGRLKIVPERFEKVWFHWLENIRDWCISRQLWWGHQIPVWYVTDSEGKQLTSSDRSTQYCELSESEVYAKARADWGDDVTLVQDEDVLDTWFSSGLWPFSTLGWPRDTADLRNFYPTQMLETGYDIIFFWVARMVMLGLELTDKEPFDTVYLHGLIRTADGKKMSKSRPDKIIDPLELIDTYGTDATRFFLITAGAAGNDIKMDARKIDGKWRSERIEGARNFANKLWNVARFVISKVGGEKLKVESGKSFSTIQLSLADKWIIARREQVIADVSRLMNDYQYGEAGKLIYDFIWSEYCDWYVELSKLNLNAPVLIETLDIALRLLHPFMPYVTEEIWQVLKETTGEKLKLDSFEYPALMLAPYPQPSSTERMTRDDVISEFTIVQDIIRAIRNARSENNVEVGKRIPAIIVSEKALSVLSEMRESMMALARLDDLLMITKSLSAPSNAIALVLGDATVYLPLAGLVDLGAERVRLQNELVELNNQITKGESLLESDFGKRAPTQVVEKEKARLDDARAKKEQIEKRLRAM
jgi:valyl-tRNA synthetase